MTRWRPPQPASSPYITPEGYAALEREVKDLWAKRRLVNDALAAAAAEGDRSENAEYQYRKKEQAGIDRRIRYLQKRMPQLKIIDQVGNHKQVFFGAKVTLKSRTGQETQYRIVGPDENDTNNKLISIDSPLAKALLKKQVDDDVCFSVDEEQEQYTVLKIEYR